MMNPKVKQLILIAGAVIAFVAQRLYPATWPAYIATITQLGAMIVSLLSLFHVPASVVAVVQALLSAIGPNAAVSVPAPKLERAMKITKHATMAAASAAILMLMVGCTPAAGPIVVSQVPDDVLTDIGCFVADALAGTQDVAQIFAQCGALTAEQAAELLAALQQGGGIAVKAGANVIRVPVVNLTDAQHARLAKLQSQLGAGQ